MKQSEQDTDDLLPTNGRKPTYIKEQHNYNCQQFFGNISNCTFTMPPATPASSMHSKHATKEEAYVEEDSRACQRETYDH